MLFFIFNCCFFLFFDFLVGVDMVIGSENMCFLFLVLESINLFLVLLFVISVLCGLFVLVCCVLYIIR